MRIVYLHQYFNTPDMAGGTRSYEIGRRLVAAGHQVDLVTSWQEPTESKDWFATDVAGMRVHWLPVRYSNHMSYRMRIGAFLKFSLKASIYVRHMKADVVLATSTPLTIALPGALGARHLRVPMVFEIRDLWPELPIVMGAIRNPVVRWGARKLEDFAYSNAAQIIALSPGIAAGVARTGYPSKKIHVVPNGSDLDLFKRDAFLGDAFRMEAGIPKEKILVGYAGTLGRINGVAYLAKLAAQLKDDQRFAFIVIGDGQERGDIEALAKSLSILGRNFFMLPKLAKAKMPAAFSAFDVATSLFLPIPEMESNSANKFFDALASGCCVAINYGGWHADLLQQSVAGFRLATNIPQAATQLQVLMSDKQQLAVFGRNARRLAEEQFSRNKQASSVDAILRNVVGCAKTQQSDSGMAR
jgi:glycosyltransferase involved in cell wall biosynthesis